MQSVREMKINIKSNDIITCTQFVNDQLIFPFLNDLNCKQLRLKHFYILKLKTAIRAYKNIQPNIEIFNL